MNSRHSWAVNLGEDTSRESKSMWERREDIIWAQGSTGVLEVLKTVVVLRVAEEVLGSYLECVDLVRLVGGKVFTDMHLGSLGRFMRDWREIILLDRVWILRL